MKKIILSIALVLAGVMGMNAQTSTSFGIKLNGNLTDVKLSDLQGSSSSFRPGASLGGFAQIKFSENFSLQPELLFNYTEAKVKYAGGSSRFKYGSAEIPVYAVGSFKVGNGKFYLGAGPNVGYGFSIDKETERIPEGQPGENKLEMNHWYLGGGVMAGYEFANGIQINAGYKMSWDLSSKNKTSDIKTQTISLGIGYRF